MKEKSLSVGGGDGLAEEKVPKVKATESLENLVVELTGTNFENAVQSGVAFVKFYAPCYECFFCIRFRKFRAVSNISC